MKVCSKCKRSLPESEFNKSIHRKNGLHYYCKDCRAKYHHTVKSRYISYKKHSLEKGREFDISFFDFMTLVVQKCHYCGHKDGIYIGIDRVDSSKGYIKDNMVPCCKRCNTAKMALAQEEFKSDTFNRWEHELRKSSLIIKQFAKELI